MVTPAVSSQRGKILVIRGGAIGDFILTLPALTALRNQFPNAHIELMGYTRTNGLALAAGLVDAVHSIESRAVATFFSRRGPFDTSMQEYFASFSLIICYLYDPDTLFQTNIASVAKAQFIVGPHRPDENLSLPASKVFLQPLERLAIFDADPVPSLSLGTASSANTPTIAVHPGSGSERKNWPEARWRSLLERIIAEMPHQLLLIGGEAEGSRLEQLGQGLPQERFKILRNQPLVEVGQALQGVNFFLGHDSGISHLAAAMGRPGLVLWGHTNASIWCPPSKKIKALQHPTGLEDLTVETVLIEVRRLAMG